MRSPLSGVMACIFFEFLKSGPFQNILPKQSTYFHYIDDVLLIYPHDTNLPDLVDQLNKVKHTIEFTHKMEQLLTHPRYQATPR